MYSKSYVKCLPNSEKRREKRLLVILKLTTLSWVWEAFLSCSTMGAHLIQCKVSLLEATLFLSSVNGRKRLLDVNNLCQKLCFISCWLEDIQQILNYKMCKKIGSRKLIYAKKLKNLFLTFLNSFIQWQCFRWLYFSFNKTANFLRLTNPEQIKLNIGSFISTTQWIS